jgi:hypothetical protein
MLKPDKICISEDVITVFCANIVENMDKLEIY